MQESSGFVATFGFAVIIIFLALAALFESFRDPIVILVSVPMSIAGALIVLLICSILQMPGASLNIYSEVGLVTLMGLISKHGILIVEFANALQEQGKSKREAIEEAADDSLPADPDDHGGDGVRRGAAPDGERRRRGVALLDRPDHLLRPRDRHAVHALRRAGGLYADRRGASPRHGGEPILPAPAPQAH